MEDAHRSIGHRRLALASVDSTNSIAASHALDPANHGLVVTAEIQTAGRGQYDRVWQATPGSSILMSVLLFPPPFLLRPSILTAWAAVSVCETIQQTAGWMVRIKWPNDILIDGKKICGILCEGGVRHIVAGIGLNVNQTAEDFSKSGLPDAASMSMFSGRCYELPDLVQRLIQQLDQQYENLLRGKLAPLEADWRARIGLIDKSIVVVRMDGSELRGRLCQLSFEAIEVRGDDGSFVHLRPEAIRHIREESDPGTVIENGKW